MKAVVLVLVLSACARRVPVTKPKGATVVTHFAMYCFEADIKHKKGRHMAGCADTLPLCQEALGSARKWGALGGVTRLYSCERWVGQ